MNKQEMLLKLDDFAEDLEYQERAENTIKKYVRVVSSFINAMPEDRDITKKDIIQWKSNLMNERVVHTKDGLEPYKTTSVNDFIVIVNKYLSYVENGIERKGNTSKLEVNTVRTQNNFTVNNVVSNSDVDRLIKTAYKLGWKDMALIIQVLVYTGIRINELDHFTVENLKNKTQIKIHSKGKIRQITIPKNLNDKLKRYIQENEIESGYVFYSPRDVNKPLSRKTIDWRFKKIASVAKVKKKKSHAHSFRHRFTINLSEDGYPTETIADILGHSSSETTRRYLRQSDEEMQQIMNDNEAKNRRRKASN